MGVRLRLPTETDLAAPLERCRTDELTYGPVGISLGQETSGELTRRHWTTTLPGVNSFDRACDTLRTCTMHRRAGLVLLADGPIPVGTNVAFCPPLPTRFAAGTCPTLP